LSDAPAPSADHAEAEAQAELDHRTAREVVLRGVARGNPRLRPAARVLLRGAAHPLDGTYVLTDVTHTVNAEQGFLSAFTTAPPSRPRRDGGALALLGEVTRVDDSSGRVRAKLPSISDVETDWMQVASVGAGSGKGLAMLPDVGDQVLLLCANADPTRGVVLGGLWGQNGPKDAGVSGGAVKRSTLLTASGLLLRLDDAEKTLRLEDPTGSYLELSPHGVKLHATQPLTLEAPGQPVIIAGDTIDFRRK